jgi:hypothetical protein
MCPFATFWCHVLRYCLTICNCSVTTVGLRLWFDPGTSRQRSMIRKCHKMKHIVGMTFPEVLVFCAVIILVIYCFNDPSCFLHKQLYRTYLDKYESSCDVILPAHLYGDDSPQTLLFQDYCTDRTQARCTILFTESNPRKVYSVHRKWLQRLVRCVSLSVFINNSFHLDVTRNDCFLLHRRREKFVVFCGLMLFARWLILSRHSSVVRHLRSCAEMYQ